MKHEISVSYEEVAGMQDLDQERQSLIGSAIQACELAYAPYSKFHVGAAIQLSNGQVLTGSNKENASFPAGTCAERNVLNYASDHHKGELIKRLAVSAQSVSFEMAGILAPCGICRQVICEVERAQEAPIEILMHSPSGPVVIVSSGKDLLPFHFYVPQLQK